MSPIHGSWIWYELMTPDPAGSKAFYEKIVGWSVVPPHPSNPGYSFIANPDGGMTGGMLHLTDEMQQHGARAGWLGYIGVDNCDEAVAAIGARGGKTLMPARDIPMAGRIAMVADPDGVPFYVMTPKPPPGAPQQSTAFSQTLTGRCAWNELLAGNQQKALDFYSSLFGWSQPDGLDMGAMGTYQFVAHAGQQVGAIMQKPPQAPAPHWHHYFRVENLSRASAEVSALGGQILFGPMEVPDDDHIIQAIDPQGAHFELVGKLDRH